MSNISNSFLQATEIMINQKLSEISYDKTLVCEILSVNKDKAEYVVSDGTTKFTAYADADKNYIVGQKVYVIIPQGNFSMKKIIIGGYDVDDTGAYEYIHPFDKFVDVSGNLLKDYSSIELTVSPSTDGTPSFDFLPADASSNGEAAAASFFNIADVPNNFGELKYIGLTVTFTTLLDRVSKGNYGIRVDLKRKDNNVWDYVEFDSSELYGNPYYYDSGFTFSKAFNYPLGAVYDKGIIKLYQNGNFNISGGEIKASNIYLCFAYDQADFTENKFTITQSDNTSLEYSNDNDPVQINATHIVYNKEKSQYEKDEIEPDDPISWYRYRVGTTNVGGGTHWEQLFKYNNTTNWLKERDGQVKYQQAFKLFNLNKRTNNDITTLELTNNKKESPTEARVKISDSLLSPILGITIPKDLGDVIKELSIWHWDGTSQASCQKYIMTKEGSSGEGDEAYYKYYAINSNWESNDTSTDLLSKCHTYIGIHYDPNNPDKTDLNNPTVSVFTEDLNIIKNNKFYELIPHYKITGDTIDFSTIYLNDKTKEDIVSEIEQPIGHPFKSENGLIGKTGVDQYRITSFPYISYQNDQIKAVLEYEDKQLESNIIKFEYNGAAAGEEAKRTNGAINLKLSDTGYYPVYGQYNELIEDYDNAIKTITASFADSRTWKDNAKSIEWRIPKNALIIPEGKLTSGENYDIIKIQEKVEGSLPNTLKYKLKDSEHYDASRAECLIECYVEVEGQKPEDKASGEVKLHFSRQGSSGTDFTIYLTDDEGNEKDFLYVVDGGDSIYLNAHIRDQQGKDIEINTNFNWEWVYGEQDGNYRVNETLDGTKQYNERIELIARNADEGDSSKNYCNAVLKVSYNMPISDGFNVNLERFYPIGFTNINNLSRITGATEVSYNGSGIPFYDKVPYKVFTKVDNSDEEKATINSISILKESQHVSMPTLTSNNELMPHSIQGVFTQNPLPWMCLNINTSKGIYIQPVFLWYDVYSSGILGSWDGSLVVDEDKNAVLASLLVAGENTNNLFTGVVIGDVEDTNADNSKTSAYGIYGYQAGVKRFSLDENGNFFVGNDRANITLDDEGGIVINGVEFDVNVESLNISVKGANDTKWLKINSDKIGTTDSVIDISTWNNDTKQYDSSFWVDGTGAMRATAGYIGNWTLAYDGLVYRPENTRWSKVGMSPGLEQDNINWCFWAGAKWETSGEGWTNVYQAPFRVDENGNLYATAGNIGGWNINSNSLAYLGDNNTVEAFLSGTALQDTNYEIISNDTTIAKGGGWIIWAKKKFGIDRNGKLWCSSANITGDFTANTIHAANNNFTVNTDGYMTCTGATITGTLKAGSVLSGLGQLSDEITFPRRSGNNGNLKGQGIVISSTNSGKSKTYIVYVSDTNALYIGGHTSGGLFSGLMIDLSGTGAANIIVNGQTQIN